MSEENDEFEPWDTDNVNFDSEDVSTKQIEIEDAQSRMYASERKITKNTFSIRYQTQNEIYILLEGVKKLMNFFLKFGSIKIEST